MATEPGGREAETRHFDRKDSSRQLHWDESREVAAKVGHRAGGHLWLHGADVLRMRRRGRHFTWASRCDFLSDAIGTLSVQNSAGSISASDLHRAVMVTQAMRFCRVMTTDEWIRARMI